MAGKICLSTLILRADETSQIPEGYTEVDSSFYSKSETLK